MQKSFAFQLPSSASKTLSAVGRVPSGSNQVAAFLGGVPRVGFTGSRSSFSQAAFSCGVFLRSFSPMLSKLEIGVGCAKGVDQLVRSAFPSANVFRVQSPVSRSAFAARSARLVQWVVAGQGLLIAFPNVPAPSKLRASSQFRGFGSGSWGSVALALGLGGAVLVVLPASVSPPGAPFPGPIAIVTRFVFVGESPCGGSFWFAEPVEQIARK